MLKEQRAILEFYGLEELDPQFWTDPPTAHPASTESEAPQVTIKVLSTSWEDPLGLNATHLDAIPHNMQSKVSIGSKDFNAQTYLTTVHKSTKYADLEDGLRHLTGVVEQRTETLKSLVKTHFDRFVGAKSTVDAVYTELKNKNLNSAGYGTDVFHKALIVATDSANELYKPIIERKHKAEKIRSTLAVLDRFKFYFNLPASLDDYVKKQKYDQAVRDYKKGRAIVMAAFPAILTDHVSSPPTSPVSTSNPTLTATSPNNNGLESVFGKVWKEVERVIVTLRQRLVKELSDMSLPMDTQERNIGYLIDLQAPEDPVWHFITCRFEWIAKMLNDAQVKHMSELEPLAKQHEEKSHINDNVTDAHVKSRLERRARHIKSVGMRRAVGATLLTEFELVFGQDIGIRGWRQILSLIQTLCSTMTEHLPDFWRLCKSYLDGKFTHRIDRAGKNSSNKAKVAAVVDPKKSEQCQLMFQRTSELFSSLVLGVFKFLLQPSTKDQSLIDSYLASLRADTLAECYYLPVLVVSLAGCYQECAKSLRLIMASDSLAASTSSTTIPIANIVNQVSMVGMHQVIESLKRGFTDIICVNWIRDTSTFYSHEDWTLDNEEKEITTLVKFFYRFQKFVLRGLFQVVAMVDFQGPQTNRKIILAPFYLDKIRSSFFESFFGFLDGIHYLSFNPTACVDWTVIEPTRSFESGSGQMNSRRATASVGKIIASQSRRVDGTRLESRLLILLSNLLYLNSVSFPKLVKMYEELFRGNVAADHTKLCEVVQHLDGLMFDTLVKRKTLYLTELVSNGLLYNGYDWNRSSRPSAVQPYVNETLLYLVLVHSEIYEILSPVKSRSYAPDSMPDGVAVTAPLPSRIFTALLRNILQSLLTGFRQLDSVSAEGRVQALLDVRAIESVLRSYLVYMPEVRGLSKLIENAVGFTNIDAQVQKYVDSVVSAWRSDCEMEFVCLTD